MLELGRDALRLIELIAHEQIVGNRCLLHTACCIEARNERERKARGGERVRLDIASSGKRQETDARCVAHTRKTMGNECAVLAQKRHEIGDGAECGEVRKLEPELGLAHAFAQQAEELEGDTCSGEVARGTARIELGVRHGNADGNRVTRLVMIGDADLDPALEQGLDLMSTGDTAIDRHDEIWLVCHAALDCRIRERIALLVAMRDETLRLCTERA